MKKLIVAVGAICLSSSLFAAKSYVLTNWNNVAASGYDVVSYFVNKKAEKGDKKFSYCWHCAKWYFANKSDLEKFKRAPEKYAPQYGGWCAYGMAQGYFVKIDPHAWSIYKGKLYLNVTKAVRKTWLEKPAAYNRAADKNWQKFLKNGDIKKCKNLQACKA